MKEFIEKLIGRLEEEHERCINRYGVVGGNAPALEVKQCMEIVNQLTEEYKTDTTFQYVLLQTDIMKRMGIDVSSKWETATQQASALNEAYMRGRQDEIDKFARWQEEYNGGWIPCSERLPEAKKEVLIFADDNAMFVGCLMNGGFSVHDGDGWIDLKFILAWQPLPAPYQPKGE